MAGLEILCRKLEHNLISRHEQGRLIDPPSPERLKDMVDFSSNDTLSLSTSGTLTKAFLDELRRHRDFTIGSTSSRSLEGTKQYLVDLEQDLARFHGAETGLFFNSGFEANEAIWSTLPQPGDVIVHDEYVHASIHEGMRRGRATTVMFRHNDPEAFGGCLERMRHEHPGIAQGTQVVFISVESFYSMDGDSASVHALLDIAHKQLPLQNFLFCIDEAHSNGLVGPRGSGFVCHYGLEREFPIRLNTCGKALGSTGAIVLCNETIKATLLNYARNVIFTTAPTFLTVTAVRAGYNILARDEGEQRRNRLQHNIHTFYTNLTRHPQ